MRLIDRIREQEGLRYHLVVSRVVLTAGADNILPLARPITIESGQMINEIFMMADPG